MTTISWRGMALVVGTFFAAFLRALAVLFTVKTVRTGNRIVLLTDIRLFPRKKTNNTTVPSVVSALTVLFNVSTVPFTVFRSSSAAAFSQVTHGQLESLTLIILGCKILLVLEGEPSVKSQLKQLEILTLIILWCKIPLDCIGRGGGS